MTREEVKAALEAWRDRWIEEHGHYYVGYEFYESEEFPSDSFKSLVDAVADLVNRK